MPGWRHAPANLYNGMIAPLTSFAIRGVIWYQGESNAVVVTNPEVKKPTGVCYNWADNPVGNLINRAGLPADTFRVELQFVD